MNSADRLTGTHLVVGLGNPGAKYAATRHNVGQMVLDHIAETAGGNFGAARRAQAVVLEGRLGIPGADERVVLAKTTTYMNVSGGPVAALAAYYDVPPERVVVVHDEVDIPFDTIRLKRGGGEGGHNGLRDITKALGTKDYLRVRVGVGRPPGNRDTADHVLAPFTSTERKSLEMMIVDAADAVEAVVLEGLTAAQQRFHSRETR
ncbi:aminoacyl-tRNA hydrolase [Brachybacterium muris]|uniref:aminoacyl-tRNA hydrolase n=1 Tax=Brachybacterium muris TaxID=219301 RepID=UPI0019588718|nr:aminoacyl-tRNA hydrolase [Brachybacterium muris]MBM7500367.1 PTH1 family peptidyl-tRNA hydrolase [Brachybacterium muris]MCT1430144.1 aminoacyl-tRNA hydrolase [Brachybacterium muris]MCT1997668.1 aminoacyl-tRNA hydrolase [Brachybacterium muris]MCT2295715.1 aminoacyl-tRNA hydrolase [Brachybacterium muris]